MGLDMYCMRARKLTESEVNKVSGLDFDKIPYLVFGKSEEDGRLYADLKDYSTPVKYKVSYWDMDKIKKDFDIPKSARICGSYYGDGVTFTFTWKGRGKDKYKEISFKEGEVEDYIKKELEDGFVVSVEKVAYWRKAYDLQDEIHFACDKEIDNCGYYKVNEEMLKAMQRTEQLVGETKDDLFYMEWY